MFKKREKKLSQPLSKTAENKTADNKIEPKQKKSEDLEKVKPKEIKEFKIRANFIRISPRKIRLVANLIKGLTFEEAWQQLIFQPKRASKFLKKILKTVEATATHNYYLAKEDLYIKNILVNQGPTLHRYKAAAHGSAHPIRKRSSHLVIFIAKQEQLGEKQKKVKKVFERLGFKKEKKLVKK